MEPGAAVKFEGLPASRAPAVTPSGAGGPAGRPRSRWRRLWRTALIVAAVVVIAVSVMTARLFIWPDRDMPARVSAIVMLDSPGNSVAAALRLERQHRAPFLVISQGTYLSGYGCPAPIPRVKLICFNPSPATTQGEAEFVGRLAKKYHWHSIAVITITPQASRARLRVERCFHGPVYAVTRPIALHSWPYEIAYEWGAMIKALVLQRGC
jgi:hypothetical protein